jgi:benzoate/toluate 1,2-dioxygenase reductase component
VSHQVALSFEDGVTRFITCQDDQTVADASYRARINIPLDCRDGACGTCKAVCESGTYDGGVYIEDALTEKEAAEGFCLPCSMKPRSDLVLQIASTSAVAKTSAATYTTTVTALERLSPTTVAISLQAPPDGKLAFLPGQYVNISVPGSQESRSYSFSSAPEADELSFLVKVTPGGLMSEYLTGRAAVGDEITFTGPHGSFFLREAERPALLLAGGTGLAPILSILRQLAADNSDRRVHLVYGVSTDDDLVELETLDALASDIESFTWDHCVADKASRAANTGYVTSLIAPDHLNDGDVAVYLCGPPPMVEAVRSDFAGRGVEPSGFYYEKFTPAAHLAAPAVEKAAAGPDVVGTSAQPQPRSQAQQQAEPQPHPQPVSAQPETGARPALTPVLVGDADPLARSVAGQVMLPAAVIEPLHGAAPPGADTDPAATARTMMGQRVARVGSEDEPVALDDATTVIEAPDARDVAGQLLWPRRSIDPLVARTPDMGPAPESDGSTILADGYEIGEEHPSVHESDAVFEARQALELGALELVIGRLSSRQLVGYRLLAEATVPYVDGDRFVDAAAYTETNAAFHDYLFTQTGNDHLLHAYHALGVKGAMEEALRHATWCHPLCAQDHLDIVDAFEAKDRERARRLVSEHADRSKMTMRRAMDETMARKRPAFVTPGRFAGQVVVVTGAAQGIGECTARRIAAEGGILVLADRSDLVEQLATELSTAGQPAHAVVADLETWEGASAVVEKAVAQHGRVDVSVHTVGGTIWAKPFADYPPEQVQAEISRSLFPTLWSCRAVVPHMIEQGHGTIVNVSSIATRGLNRVPYAAAKGGVNAITSALALEVAPHGIRVVATAPGGTDAPSRRVPRGPAPASEQEQAWYRTVVDQTVESSLMKRYGTLDEQAAAICFLASAEASYITGTVLPVAGGDLG